MSGHLLRTVNPDAADMIEAQVPKRIPQVGAPAVYHCRPGEGRRGLVKFPGLVLRSSADTGIDMIVFFDAEDFRLVERLQPWTEQNPVFCYTASTNDPTLFDRLDQLAEELETIKAAVFGEFDAPSQSVIGYLASFEKKLADLAQKIGAPALAAKKGGKSA